MSGIYKTDMRGVWMVQGINIWKDLLIYIFKETYRLKYNKESNYERV